MQEETTIKEILSFIKLQWHIPAMSRQAVLMLGAPGWGKSMAPCELFEGRFAIYNANQAFREDAGGQKYAEPGSDNVKLLLGPEAKQLFDVAAAHPDKPVGLIIEEFPQGDAEVQKSLSPVLNDRLLCGRPLPDNVIVVANGNSTKHSSGANRGLAHITNRVAVFNLKHSVEEWKEWAASNDINEKILAYLTIKPQALYLAADANGQEEDTLIKAQLKKAASEYKAFPTPRSWTKFSYTFSAIQQSKKVVDQDTMIKYASAFIGTERAADFVALSACRVPERMDLLNGVEEWPTNPYEEWTCILREAKMTDQGTAEKVANILSNIDPEMVVVYFNVLRARLVKEPGANKLNPMIVLRTWPGFDKLISEDSRYGAAMRASTGA